MKYRTIGKTEIQTSELGFGMWTVSMDWWGKAKTDAEAIDLLHQAHHLGVTFYDAADLYGNGRSEELLAKAFGSKRDQIVIATKFGYDFHNHPARGHQERPQDWSPAFIRKACEASLKRLGTDHIDLYQLHNPKMDAIENNALWETLSVLQQEGKVRAIGIALGPAIGWKEEGIRALRERPIDSLQTVYNLLEQDPGRDFFCAAQEKGAGTLIRVPHASGILDGTLTLDTPIGKSDHRAFRKREFIEEALQKADRFKPFFAEKEMTMGQAALKFCLGEPTVFSVLPNIYNHEQLVEFAAFSEQPNFTDAERAELIALFERNFDVPALVPAC